MREPVRSPTSSRFIESMTFSNPVFWHQPSTKAGQDPIETGQRIKTEVGQRTGSENVDHG